MDGHTTPPKRSRLAPDPDFTGDCFTAPEEKPVVGNWKASAGAAEPTARIAELPATRESAGTGDGPVHVIVTDIHMRFWSMVSLMVKLAFATIPAAIIITLFVMVTIAVAARLSGVR